MSAWEKWRVAWGKGNLGCKSKMMMALLSNYEERFGTCFPSWAGLPVNYHVQQLERKDDELGHCFSHNTTHSMHNPQQIWKRPWLEKLSLLCAVWPWGHKLLTLLVPHLPVMFLLFPGLVLSTGMCTELFQFHISPVASTPSNQTSDSDTPLRMLQTQWLQKLNEAYT